MNFSKTTLSNGLRVLTAPMPAMESATVQVLIGAGSRNESPEHKGLAHFLEHMVFKGTEKYPTSQSISQAIDGIGGEINASTGKERTGYYIKAWERYLTLAFDILSQFVRTPRLLEKDIKKEKGVILEEIAMYEDLPMHKAPCAFEELLFAETPLGWDIAGTAETVRAARQEDFQSFITEHYHPKNMVLSVAGKFGQKEVLKMAQEYFGGLERSNLSNKTNLTNLSNTNPSGNPEAKLINKKTEQAHLVLGVRGNPLGHPDRYKEAVIASILGGGSSSWLWSEIREKRGFAYYVRSDVDHYRDSGYLAARAGVRLDKASDVVKIILKQFGKLKTKGGVKSKELKKAKEYLKGRLALGLEDTHSVSEFFGDQELFEEKVRTVEEVMAGIDAVSLDDICKVADDFFQNSKLNLAIVGPYEEEGQFQQLLKM